MAANKKDCHCQQLPNHLQNLHLICYTFVTIPQNMKQFMTGKVISPVKKVLVGSLSEV